MKIEFLKYRVMEKLICLLSSSLSSAINSVIKMVNIVVAGHSVFPCPVGWTVEKARNEIRSRYGLLNGGIDRNGEAMASDDIITADGDYRFVNFQSLQGIQILFSSFMTIMLLCFV